MGNNVSLLNAVDLQQIKNAHNKDGKSIQAIAKEYKISSGAAKNAVASKNVNHFKALMRACNDRENKNAIARRAAKRQNDKAQERGAEGIKELGYAYTPAQVKTFIDGLKKHADNLEDRVQTLASLLVESDDNVVTRIYRLENKSWTQKLRRFLERF